MNKTFNLSTLIERHATIDDEIKTAIKLRTEIAQTMSELKVWNRNLAESTTKQIVGAYLDNSMKAKAVQDVINGMSPAFASALTTLGLEHSFDEYAKNAATCEEYLVDKARVADLSALINELAPMREELESMIYEAERAELTERTEQFVDTGSIAPLD